MPSRDSVRHGLGVWVKTRLVQNTREGYSESQSVLNDMSRQPASTRAVSRLLAGRCVRRPRYRDEKVRSAEKCRSTRTRARSRASRETGSGTGEVMK